MALIHMARGTTRGGVPCRTFGRNRLEQLRSVTGPAASTGPLEVVDDILARDEGS